MKPKAQERNQAHVEQCVGSSTRNKTGTGRSHLQEGQGTVAAAKAVMAESNSVGEVPQSAPAHEKGCGNLRPVTVMLSPHVVGALQQPGVPVTETTLVAYGPSQLVVWQ